VSRLTFQSSGDYTIAPARVGDRVRWSACYTPAGSMLVGDGTRQSRPHELIGCFDSDTEAKAACRDHHQNKKKRGSNGAGHAVVSHVR